jgi:hypothetical protein
MGLSDIKRLISLLKPKLLIVFVVFRLGDQLVDLKMDQIFKIVSFNFIDYFISCQVFEGYSPGNHFYLVKL